MAAHNLAVVYGALGLAELALTYRTLAQTLRGCARNIWRLQRVVSSIND